VQQKVAVLPLQQTAANFQQRHGCSKFQF